MERREEGKTLTQLELAVILVVRNLGVCAADSESILKRLKLNGWNISAGQLHGVLVDLVKRKRLGFEAGGTDEERKWRSARYYHIIKEESSSGEQAS